MNDTPDSYDKFSLPGDIPDADAPRGTPTQDWLSRGLRHPAGRGWDCEADVSPREGGDLGDPGRAPHAPGSPPARGLAGASPPPAPDDRFFAPGPAGAKFDDAAQVRFLDALASSGNVRVSAARAGVSHETAYRQRRRDPRFAALWSAALVHARERVASEMGDRALDGVIEDVWFRGELVGQRRRYDSRLLLAHMARLDQLAGQTGDARDRVQWFDAELARLAGHPDPDGFFEAHGVWDRDRAKTRQAAAEAPLSPPPPTMREFVAWFREQALDGVEAEEEDRMWDDAGAEAEALYEEWEDGAAACLDAILYGNGEADHAQHDGGAPNPPRNGEGDRTQGGGGGFDPLTPPEPAPDSAPPREYKSRELGRARPPRRLPLHPVTSVNSAFSSRSAAQLNNGYTCNLNKELVS